MPLAARVLLLQQYPHLIIHTDVLKAAAITLNPAMVEKLNRYQLIDAGQWETFVQDVYSLTTTPPIPQSMGRDFTRVERVLSLPDLSDANINVVNYLLPEFVPVL